MDHHLKGIERRVHISYRPQYQSFNTLATSARFITQIHYYKM